MATIELNDFEIKELTSEKNLQKYFIIVNNNNRDEAYFCFENMVKKGWDILSKNPSPNNIEIEYLESEERDKNGNPYRRVINLYSHEDDEVII